MKIFIARRVDSKQYFKHTSARSGSLSPSDTSDILHAKMARSLLELANYIPDEYVECYEILRLSLKLKGVKL